MEHPVREQGQDRAFFAERAADQGIDGHQKHELPDVPAQPQPDSLAGRALFRRRGSSTLSDRPRSGFLRRCTGSPRAVGSAL
jgi:hypothetical protein